MTTRTIEVERTVTDEDTIEVCDDCGHEITDGDGVTYHSTNGGSRAPDLHFHKPCIGNVALDGEYEMRTYREYHETDTPERHPVQLVWSTPDTLFAVVGIIMMLLTVYAGAYLMLGAATAWFLLMVAIARMQATKPAEHFEAKGV